MTASKIQSIVSRGPRYHSLIPSKASDNSTLSSTNQKVKTYTGHIRSSSSSGIITTCASYLAVYTNNAYSNTVNCNFIVPAGVSIMIADCVSFGCISGSSNQFIRLYD